MGTAVKQCRRRLSGVLRARSRVAVTGAASAAVLLLVMAASALAASPAWELIANHYPTNVPLLPSRSQVEQLTFHGNAGKFALHFELEEPEEEGTTHLLRFDASAKEVQVALEKLKEAEPTKKALAGNVVVTGGYSAETGTGSYQIEFVGAFADRDMGSEALSVEFESPSSAEEAKLERKGIELIEIGEGEEEVEALARGYHDMVILQLIPRDLGAEAASAEHKIAVLDKLPNGLATRALPSSSGWSCSKPGASEKEREQEEKEDTKKQLPLGAGLTEVECVAQSSVNPDGSAPPLYIDAYVDTSKLTEGSEIANLASISGGGAASVQATPDAILVSSSPASFGLHGFRAGVSGPSGEQYTQAGGHPYAATTSFFANTVLGEDRKERFPEIRLPGELKDADVTLPAGFIGNPLAVARCSQAEFTEGTIGGPVPNGACKPESQVGSVSVYFKEPEGPENVALYDLEPPPGVPAEFGFIFDNVPVRLDAHLVRKGEYRVTVLSADVNEGYNILGIVLTLWGDPAEPSHMPERFVNKSTRGAGDSEPEKPFLENPVDCVAEASSLETGAGAVKYSEDLPLTTIAADSWERPGGLDAGGNPVLSDGNWTQAQYPSPPVTGCNLLSFDPAIEFTPASTKPDVPSGYTFTLSVPQNEEVGGLATPELRDTTVTLPEGLVLSPSAANGLQACAPAEIELTSVARGNCPDASQVGDVTIESALLEKPLQGRVYVGEPECSPCSGTQVEEGKLLMLYIEAEGAGVRVKLPGSASVNQQTGRITTTFLNNPQLPFTKLTLTLKGGQRAPLANPEVCGGGLYASATLTPWSLGGLTEGGVEVPGTSAPGVTKGNEFAITGCPASLPFTPTFSAGTENSKAGAYTNLDVTFSRQDGEQTLSGVTVRTPPGLLGKIAGIPRCEGLAAESSTVECSSASRIGTATSAAGAGSEPYVVSGPVYLTGGFEGAPFGLKIAVPANAGPFHLGTVVVRAAINIDKTTSAITVTSQPLPQSIDGIPFRLKTVKVDVNRPEFIFNPTNCETQSISAALSGKPVNAAEAAAGVQRSAPFTASDCAALSFAPSFTATTEGHTSKLDGASLTVRVTQHPGEADIHKVELQLPEALPSRNETLQKACTEKQFAANPSGCPEGSLVGSATAHTPLLSAPLAGPAYLVSHGGAAFPDLVFLLQGEGVHIELVGHTNIRKIGSKEITFSKFETVPDAPISSFETVLPEGPHSLLDFFGEFCEKKELFAPTTITAQDNARVEQNTRIVVTGCPPTLAIVKSQVKSKKLLLTLKLSAAGVVKVSGTGLKAITTNLAAGTHQLAVALNKTGEKYAKKRKKMSFTASLTVGKQTAAKSASVKA